jgi:hypothetical protein
MQTLDKTTSNPICRFSPTNSELARNQVEESYPELLPNHIDQVLIHRPPHRPPRTALDHVSCDAIRRQEEQHL